MNSVKFVCECGKEHTLTPDNRSSKCVHTRPSGSTFVMTYYYHPSYPKTNKQQTVSGYLKSPHGKPRR